MEPRGRSLLIALALGDGCVTRRVVRTDGGTRHVCTLEVRRPAGQEEYLEWKAGICRGVTGSRCAVRHGRRKVGRGAASDGAACWFSSSHRYFKAVHHWLYKSGRKTVGRKVLDMLTPEGLAIWFMDRGSTYVSRKRPGEFTCELYTHAPMGEAQGIIDYFRERWDIVFHLHGKGNDRWSLRCYTSNAARFIKLIEPFVPRCMGHKTRVPRHCFHEDAGSGDGS